MTFADFAQLGIGSALVFVFWRLGVKLIDMQAAGDTERTKALTAGLESIHRTVIDHAASDTRAHGDLSSEVAEVKGMLTERKYTPVEGTPIISSTYGISKKKA